MSPFYEDLQTLLTEVNGDVQVAATRITEGILCVNFFYELNPILSFRACRTMGFGYS